MKSKNIITGLCLGLSINLFMLKPAKALDPFTGLVLVGIGAWMNHEASKNEQQEKSTSAVESLENQEENLVSKSSEAQEENSSLVGYIHFDEELSKKISNSKIVSVSKGVVQNYGVSVDRSFEVSFGENERKNFGGNIGIVKMERAITKDYSQSYGQQIASNNNVSLDGNLCQEYLVQEIINYRRGKITVKQNGDPIDFEIVDNVELKTENLCAL